MKKLFAALFAAIMTLTGALSVHAEPYEFRAPVKFFDTVTLPSGSVKRQVLTIALSPNTAAAVDSTVYRGEAFFGRAGIVKRITFGAQTPPVGGTDTLKALKGSSSGNTMLNAATFDATTLVANTASNATLTSTAADLSLTATQPVYVEYSAGVQTTDAVGVFATIEFEPTDF